MTLAFVLLTGSLSFPFESRFCAEYVRYLWGWIIFVIVVCILSYVTASLAFPLVDERLSEIDLAMGFDWMAWRNFIAKSVFDYPMYYAYNALLPLIVLSVFVLARSTSDGNSRLLWSVILAAGMTIILFGLFPSMGPWVQYHVTNAPPYIDHMHRLRSGLPVTFELGRMEGIVPFPSFHAALAVLFAYAHRGLRTFYPVAVVCAFMWISALTVGGHYLIDLLAGTMVAVVAIGMAQLIQLRQGASF
jgi:membrane-associated phospholipid phosphatase